MRCSLQTLMLLAGLVSGPCAAATPLTELYKSTPAPPKDPATALAWVKDGKVVAPEIVTLESNLQAAQATALAEATKAAAGAPAATPDTAAVSTAAAGYRAYVAANEGANAPEAVLGGRVKWLASRFSGLKKRVAGTDRATEVREQELAAYRSLFADWQTQRTPIVSKAQAELAAAGEPTAIASPESRAAVQRYRAAMINEVEVLLGLTRFSVERAAGLESADASTVESGNTLWDLMTDTRKRPRS
ncbi:hypothetical protein DFR24_3689 [Panacagrimonas perspica]|uniref:Uncharacterized protein n=1 Tax=Panacagrimonas perspica TaxID=381431 RepID=A0A4R7P1D2_9GAMM|nr:hypothetical protein [Panacagrimonas perspica]TDU26660.1 hypothetical protein DFR24_3689 [Panacagrimonas perspica]THD04014.1 hypothetical protein B1810_07065 [Panacagrimonas perspica]